MVAERKIENLSSKDRLEALIDLGIRDAKNQPDAPAMTLILGMHSDLIRYVFEDQRQDYSEDVAVQGGVIGTYVVSELARRGEATLAVRTTVFIDRTNTQGIYVYMSGMNSRVQA